MSGSKLPRLRRPRRAVRTLVLEALEERLAPASVSFINPAGGAWDAPSNWSTGKVPTVNDDVTIGLTSDVTVSINSSDNESVHSLTTAASDALSITGGSLTIAASSSVAGRLSMTGGTLTVSGSGVSLNATGATAISSASLFAEAGATLSLPNLTSYADPSGVGPTFEATGVDSALALPELTTLGVLDNYWRVDATQGGRVSMPALTTIGGSGQTDYFQIEADGSGSTIDLSGLTSLSSSGGSTSLAVSEQGAILASHLTSLDHVNVTLDGTGSLATDRWTTLTFGSLTVTGGTYSFPGLTTITSASLYADSGGVLTLPNLTSYADPTGVGPTFEATGVGSTLALPELSTLGVLDNYWRVDATQGGRVSMPALTTIGGSGQADYFQIEADGSGSTIDLSGLTSLSSSGGSTSLAVSEQGAILASHLTSLDHVNVTLDGTGSLATDRWTTLTFGSLTVTGGTYSFPGLTTITSASLYADSGGVLTLPNLTSYADPTGVGPTFEATGVGSTLALPELSTLGVLDNYWRVDATQGGRVSMPALTTIGGSGQADYFQIEADGSGSTIDLSGLTSLSSSGGSTSLAVSEQGAILASHLTSLDHVNVTLDGTGSLATDRWTTLTFGSLTVTGGAYSFSGLTTITSASLYANSGGVLTLPNLTSYADPTGVGPTFEATGIGSALALPELSTVGVLDNYWRVDATQGGRVSMPALTTIGGSGQADYFQIEADGSGSTIDLSGLTSLSSSGGSTSLAVSDQGAILASHLTSLDNVHLTVTGGAYSFPNLTTITSTSLYADGGGTLSLPNLTSYADPTGVGPTFEATGIGSALALPELSTVGVLDNYWHVDATQGGRVSLPALTTIGGSGQADYFQIEADGSGSTIDLSGLTSLSSSGGSTSLAVSDQGAILASHLTSLDNVHLTVTGGAYSFPNLTTITSTSLYADGGGTLSLPNLTSYADPTGVGPTFEATGIGSALALPELSTVGVLDNYWHVDATQGGRVSLPALTAIAASSSQADYFQIEADGSGSTIDLSGLTSLSSSGGSTSLTASDQGTILLSSGAVQLTSTPATLASAGTIDVGTLDLGSGGTLGGTGTLEGNVVNAGKVTPGSPNGQLTITGNYTQTSAGSLGIQLSGTQAGTQYGQLLINGSASLGGTLAVTYAQTFTPALGNSFQVMTFDSASGAFATTTGLTIGTNLQLDPTNAGTALILTAASSQAPYVLTMNPSGPLSTAVSSIAIAFNKPINLATFTSSQVRLTGPSGLIAVSNPTFVSGDTYQITFATQSAAGTYTLQIASSVADQLGDSMQQAFIGTFSFTAAPANISFINPAGGDWDTASNWSTGTVPGPGASVQIGFSGVTVTESEASLSIGSIQSQATLDITSGSFQVTAGLSTVAALTVASGASLTATGTGTSFTVSGATTADGASLYAIGGALLKLPNLISYSYTASFGTAYLEASGTGSTLSLPGLTSLASVGPTYGNTIDIEALQGGQVLLPTLASVAPANTTISLKADGTSSLVNIAGLTTLNALGGSLTASNGGTILDTDLTTINNVNLTFDGTGTIATSQWADLDNSNVYVTGGATVALPDLISYSYTASFGTAYLEASGTGSTLSLPGLTSLASVGPTYGNTIDIEALQGGQVLLPTLASVAPANTTISLKADGTSSLVNVAGLTTLNALGGSLTASNGGTILDTDTTTINNVDTSPLTAPARSRPANGPTWTILQRIRQRAGPRSHYRMRSATTIRGTLARPTWKRAARAARSACLD